MPLSTTCILIFDFGMFRLWYFGMFRQCGILKCSDSVVFFVFLFYFRAIPTVWYFGMFRLCDILVCSDSVVFILECSDSVVFWNVPTVWYFGIFWQCGIYFGMFRQCGILECSDSVVFVCFLFHFHKYRSLQIRHICVLKIEQRWPYLTRGIFNKHRKMTNSQTCPKRHFYIINHCL